MQRLNVSKELLTPILQAYELTLNLPTSFEVVGAGIGQLDMMRCCTPILSGAIASVTGTGTGGAFENPSSTVVDGTYTVTASDYTARLDTEWANQKNMLLVIMLKNCW